MFPFWLGVAIAWGANKLWWRLSPSRKAANPSLQFAQMREWVIALQQREREWIDWYHYMKGAADAANVQLPDPPGVTLQGGVEPTRSPAT